MIMILKKTSRSQILGLVMFAALCASFAKAQLSTSVSQPLDSNLYGQNVNVAPTPSSEIEPGANDLLTPEERQLPYDALGASIIATALDPTVIQYYGLSRTPYQVDNSVRDSTQLTGQRQRSPINVVEVISQRTSGLESSTQLQASSYQGASSLSSATGFGNKMFPLASGLMGQGAVLTSSWKAGSSSSQPPAHLFLSSAENAVSSSTPAVNAMQKPGRLLHRQSGSNTAKSQIQTQRRDYSKSPLEASEASDYENQAIADTSASPFRDLGQTSFLNPDITQPALHPRNSREERTSFSTLQNTGSLGRFNNPAPGATDIEGRLLRQRGESRKTRKPKWHNPILELMENGSKQ